VKKRELLTASAYARHRETKGFAGATREAVRRALRDARIHYEPGTRRIDAARADREWAENTDGSKPAARNGRASATDTAAQEHARLAAVRRELLEHELEERRGFEDLLTLWAERQEEHERNAQRRLEAIPSRLGPLLAAEAEADVVTRMLREEIRLACTEIATDAERERRELAELARETTRRRR